MLHECLDERRILRKIKNKTFTLKAKHLLENTL